MPADVAIIGFGDLSGPGTFLTDLTTVRQPARQKGYQAAELLHLLMEHPDERKKSAHHCAGTGADHQEVVRMWVRLLRNEEKKD